MTTQVSFTTDEDLKVRALKKAKEEGITLKTLLVYSMKSFVDGKITLNLVTTTNEPDVEEISFDNKELNEKAEKLAKLLK